MKIIIILVVCGICASVPKIRPIPRHLSFSIRSKHNKTPHKQKPAYPPKEQKSSPEHNEVTYSKPVYRETQKEISHSKPVYAPEHLEVPYIELIYAPQHKEIQYTREIYRPELTTGMIIYK